jgi:hypothetical protein
MIEKTTTLEAHLLRAIVRLGGQVERGILPVKVITDTLNDEKPKNQQFSYQRIGRVLSAVGFEKGKTGNGASAIIWDEEKISLLKQSLGKSKFLNINSAVRCPECKEIAYKSYPDPVVGKRKVLKAIWECNKCSGIRIGKCESCKGEFILERRDTFFCKKPECQLEKENKKRIYHKIFSREYRIKGK